MRKILNTTKIHVSVPKSHASYWTVAVTPEFVVSLMTLITGVYPSHIQLVLMVFLVLGNDYQVNESSMAFYTINIIKKCSFLLQ